MFLRFFAELRDAKVPVSLKEYLALMEAMDREVIGRRTEEFYYLSRTALVKDGEEPRQVRPGVRPRVQRDRDS